MKPRHEEIESIIRVGAALMLLLSIAFVPLYAFWAATENISSRFSALAERNETIVGLAARLEVSREETDQRLASIAAARADLATISDAEALKALLLAGCETLGGFAEHPCTVGETPVAPSVSVYRAPFVLRAPIPEALERLSVRLSPPLRLTDIVIRPAGDGEVEIGGAIQAIGQGGRESSE